MQDKPITIDGWSPANNDGVFRGPVTLNQAFARSSNAATVRLSEEVGRAQVLRTARELGISTPLPDSPSVALGTAGVSLLELTCAYAAVASGRYPIKATGLPPSPAAAQTRDFTATLFGNGGGRLDENRDWRPMLDLLWAAANEGTGRKAALATPDLWQDRHQPGQSRRPVRRLRGRPGGRRVGRARRQQVARQEGLGRDHPGADLAQFHGSGAQHRRSQRVGASGRLSAPRRAPRPESAGERL